MKYATLFKIDLPPEYSARSCTINENRIVSTSFDPKKKAKAKERKERLNQNLLRAAKLAKPKGVSKDEKYATDIRVSSPGSTSPSPSRKNKRSVYPKVMAILTCDRFRTRNR